MPHPQRKKAQLAQLEQMKAAAEAQLAQLSLENQQLRCARSRLLGVLGMLLLPLQLANGISGQLANHSEGCRAVCSRIPASDPAALLYIRLTWLATVDFILFFSVVVVRYNCLLD